MGCGASSSSSSSPLSGSGPLPELKDPTFVENTLLFLPARVVERLGIEPNLEDKGDTRKTLWLGRVWHLRALLARRYEQRKRAAGRHFQLSNAQRSSLDATLRDPESRRKLKVVVAAWSGAITRLRTQLSPLRRVDPTDIRSTVVYAHGSGGCAWDNTRICRMIAGDGYLVICPDGFAYPADSQMGKLRRKDVAPLLQPGDNSGYWEGDLVYRSKSAGELTYSTSADAVLQDPKAFRDLYERVFKLRAAELHWLIRALPARLKANGLHLGGTSEGAMAIARFDDSRYGHLILSRFINSFSIEYCYFTPTREAASIGGRRSVPTLNIIGTNDEYFGRSRSVAQLVSADTRHGYGSRALQGHGYETLVRQKLTRAAVCYLDGGTHSPCTTHDNFLRELLRFFLARPSQVPYLHEIWQHDAALSQLCTAVKSTARPPTRQSAGASEVTLLHVPPMKLPQEVTVREMRLSRLATSRRAMSVGHLSDKMLRAVNEQRMREEAEAARVEALLQQLDGRARAGEFKREALPLSGVLLSFKSG